ncbi:MAG: cytochrome c3 family protein [Nitrospirota bacterium]
MARDDAGNLQETPHKSLVLYSCLGCHSATDSSTWKNSVTNAPVVFNSLEPVYNTTKGLAAGNFYWVLTDDTKGHNVFSSNPENTLNPVVAPGDPGRSTCGTDSCHADIHGTVVGAGYDGRQGCTKCHMVGSGTIPKGYHHLDDTGPVIDSAAEGWYRFLDGHEAGAGHGASGIEDDDWQFTNSANDHNEYVGFNDGSKSSAGGFSLQEDTMSGFCCGCHGNFHIEDTTSSGSSPWIRHPSDSIIPNAGEYSKAFNATGGTGTYDPVVPVARPSLSGWTGPVSTVTLGSGGDLVMCLSCHRAHASPYFKMLRWDYKGWPGSGGTNGCNVCHTSKN